MKNTTLMTTILLGLAQNSTVAVHGQSDIIWQPSLGKNKIKPRNKRGSNWKSLTQETHEKKPHNQRNKKGKP
jgi:hypothetical protein